MKDHSACPNKNNIRGLWSQINQGWYDIMLNQQLSHDLTHITVPFGVSKYVLLKFVHPREYTKKLY